MIDMKKIWEMQEQQQRELGLDPVNMIDSDRSEESSKQCLGLYEEVAEVARLLGGYKGVVIGDHPIDKAALALELADVLKYLLVIAQLNGLEASDLWNAFKTKTEVIRDRTKRRIDECSRVVCIDLDGVVVDLGGLDKLIEHKSLIEKERLKAEFRREGGFETLPAVYGAVDGIKTLKRMGYKIVFITSRPYKQYKRLYGDTLRWLVKNDIVGDKIIFKRDKAEAVVEYIHPAQPICFIEDRLKHALEVKSIGVPVLLFGGHQNFKSEPGVIDVVANWDEIVERLTEVHCEK